MQTLAKYIYILINYVRYIKKKICFLVMILCKSGSEKFCKRTKSFTLLYIIHHEMYSFHDVGIIRSFNDWSEEDTAVSISRVLWHVVKGDRAITISAAKITSSKQSQLQNEKYFDYPLENMGISRGKLNILPHPLAIIRHIIGLVWGLRR